MFDKNTGAFYDINPDELEMAKTLPPPENCPCCIRLDQQGRDKECRTTKDEKGILNGFTLLGQKYHYEDFVRYYSDDREGPANLGYITEINVESGGKSSKDKSYVTCRKVGRIGDLEAILPAETMRDEVSAIPLDLSAGH